MVDIPGTSSTSTSLSIGGSLSSAIDFVGDHDWIKISLTAGQAVDITVALGTMEDSYLTIRDSGGAEIKSDDDIIDGVQRGSEVKFTPTYTGVYYIDVSAWADPNQGQPGDTYTGTGTYTVTAQLYTAPPVGTIDQIAYQLTTAGWGGDVHHWNVTQGGTITVDIHTLTAAEQNFARTALSEWSDIIGVHFQEVTGGAQISFNDAKDTDGSSIAQTDANWSNGIITSATVQISSDWSSWSSLDSYGLQTYIHEIGHALGLDHAGNYNGSADYPYDASFANDAWSTTVMSYFSPSENSYFSNQGFSNVYTLTPMVADILAMQSLYGLSTTTRTGDTIYGYHSNAGGMYNAVNFGDVAVTLFDSGGNDTIDYSLSTYNQRINLNPETFSNVNGSTGNLDIARGTIIENAIGGSGSDTLIGNWVGNVLTGNGGADSLTGGAGRDVFSDTKANHNGDTITDFRPWDTIIFTDAALAGFTFSLSGHTLTYTGGTLTLNGAVTGKFVASAVASGGVQLSEIHAVANDFNGDGRSDVLWRNSSGYLTDWLGTSTGGFSGNGGNAGTGAADASWSIAGTGDFNGDGISDILWRNSSGYVTEWLGNGSGGFTANAAAGNGSADANWQIAGTGDFNGDSITDVLWRNSTSGYVTDWLGTSTGAFNANGAAGSGAAGTTWQVAGTGDFNGDGYGDILWRNASGYLTEWVGTSTGGFSSNQANAGNGSADSSWTVAGTGDFNGDGYGDILWRNSGGYVTDWLGSSTGAFASNNANAGTAAADANWQIAGTGDFNGDGFSDILWRNNSSGYVTEWLGGVNGGFTSNSANAGTGLADTSWHVHDTLFG